MPEQVKRGYLRGVRGVLLTPLEPDGSPKDPAADAYWIDTAQTVGVDVQVVDGEVSDLRGGDKLLVRVEDEDYIVGADLSFTDARFDAKVAEIIGAGSLIAEGEGEEEEIVGWEAPTVEDQFERDAFKAEVYVQSFNARGGREAYLKYTFRYCRGFAPNIDHSDQEWGTPEFTIKAREHPAGESAYKKEFVDSLPVEAGGE